MLIGFVNNVNFCPDENGGADCLQMPQFGATEQWTAEECELVWRQLSGEDTGASSGDGS